MYLIQVPAGSDNSSLKYFACNSFFEFVTNFSFFSNTFKEIYRQDWMFKLVGKEHFQVSKTKCCISIEAVSGFAYEYSLEVNGKPLKKFQENQSRIMRTWVLYIGGVDTRVVLGEAVKTLVVSLIIFFYSEKSNKLKKV